MKKLVSLVIAIIMLVSFSVVGINAATFTYDPTSRKQTLYYWGTDIVAAEHRVSNVYYEGMECFSITNVLNYSDDVSLYNMVLYTKWEVTYTDNTKASDEFYEVAYNDVYSRTRNIYLNTDGRTIDTITITYIANRDHEDNTGFLIAFTDTEITATYTAE